MPWRRSLSIALVAALLLGACGSEAGDVSDDTTLEPGQSQIAGDADEGIDGVVAIRVSDNAHTTGAVDYDLRPPAGGPHNPVWWSCGFYDEPVIDEHAVHDLEHGVIWLAYAPDLPDADIEVLHELTRGNARVLTAPYDGLPDGDAVVATAWARQLHLARVDDPRLDEFVARYQDGSQSPEAGGSCTGSPLGSPLP